MRGIEFGRSMPVVCPVAIEMEKEDPFKNTCR
jgi:hypothetical protein